MSVRLRQFVAVNPPTPQFDRLRDDVEVPFLPLEAVWPDDRFDPSRRRRKGEVSIGYTRFVEGDILLPKITPTFQTDRTVIARNITGGIGAATTEIHVIRVGPRADARYIRYLFSSKRFLDEGAAAMVGVAGQKRIPDDYVRNLDVPVLDLTHQRTISDYLDAETARIDALVSKRRLQLELLKEQFLAQVQTQVTCDMVFADPLDVRDVDITVEGWAPLKLSVNLRFGSGTTPPAGDQRYYGNGIPWIITGNLRDTSISQVSRSITLEALEKFSALEVHPAGSLVVAMYGATIGRLGVTTYPAAVNQACCVMHTGVRVNVWFLFYYLLAHRSVLVERSVGAGQPNISQEILRSLRIPTPRMQTQEKIVEELDTLRSRMNAITKRIKIQLETLRERRQALITAAVTGELNIPGIAT